jgi:hypothetical protein
MQQRAKDPLPSCSAVEALDRQEPFINQTLKTTAKKEPPKAETTKLPDTPKLAQPVKEEPSRTASLFDAAAPPATTSTTATESDEEEEILAASTEDEPVDEINDFDESA